MKNKLFIATATLIGYVVGAGILGIPYVFSRSGYLTGIIHVILIGLSVMILNLMIGEISLRTKGSHQLVGYAEKYLGKEWKKIMMYILLFGWYGAMIAYIIKIGQFLSALFNPISNINPIYFSMLFALIATFVIYKGISVIQKSEFWMIALILGIIATIGICCLDKINPANLNSFSWSNFWFPFGVVFFSFGGAGAIPEIREELKEDRRLMKHAIIIGTLTIMLIYIIFPLFVVGVTGQETTDGAIIGLGNALGYKILLLGSLFGILTMTTSFLAIGLAIKETFKFDCNKDNLESSFFSCMIPSIIAFIIILLNIDNAFYKVIDIMGSFVYPSASIIFIFAFWKAKKSSERTPEYSLKFTKALGTLIILLFLAGFLTELVRVISMIL